MLSQRESDQLRSVRL